MTAPDQRRKTYIRNLKTSTISFGNGTNDAEHPTFQSGQRNYEDSHLKTFGIWMRRASFGKLFQRNRCLNKANGAEEESNRNTGARGPFMLMPLAERRSLLLSVTVPLRAVSSN